jgi:hypothetical protein
VPPVGEEGVGAGVLPGEEGLGAGQFGVRLRATEAFPTASADPMIATPRSSWNSTPASITMATWLSLANARTGEAG